MTLRFFNHTATLLQRSLGITIRLAVILPFLPFFFVWSTAAAAIADSVTASAAVSELPIAPDSAVIADSTDTAYSADSKVASAVPVKKPIAVEQLRKSSTPAIDSAVLLARRDSLLALENIRRSHYSPTTTASDTASDISEHELFCSDPTIWYDIPEVKRHTAGSKLGIAHGYNRLLLYGNTAPVDKRFTGTGLLYRRLTDPLSGDDATFTTEYGGLLFPGNGTIHFTPRSLGLVSPEISLYWETGVFDGNILAVRFSRPLTRNLILNVFSNYRFLKGMQFNHDNGNVYSAFAAISRDSTRLSDNGYNPLVNEYYCGADASWSAGEADAFFRVKYGDLVDEVPIDRKPETEFPDQMRIAHYPLTFEGGVSTTAHGRLFLGAEAAYASDHRRLNYALVENTTRIPRSTATSSAAFSGAFKAGVSLPAGDSLSVQCLVRQRKLSEGDSVETETFDGHPELVWERPFNFRSVQGSAAVRAGYNFYLSGTSDAGPLPLLSGSIHTTFLGTTLNAYVQRDIIDYQPVIDSTAITEAFYDDYFRTGVEIVRDWQLFGMLVGYQYCRGVDSAAVGRAWLSGTAPYDQPRTSVIIAPRLGRWHGVAISSRCMLSGSRPYVKLQSGISLLAFPKLTHETIDLRLGLDYWSERDTIIFAGSDTWNRPVVDLNFAISVHIKSFRLMYKVDNLLNRNFSYVPGWIAPGITFRWGFSWLIQR